MIEIIFESGKIQMMGTEFMLQNPSIADEFTIDAELISDGNIWTTSFNIQSVRVNGQIFQSSQEMLNFFQQ
jgi:hypothetical protein